MSARPPSPSDNVIARLRADHDEIRALLGLYAGEPSKLVRKNLLSRLSRTVRLHCAVEAGVFIPAVALATKDSQLLAQTGTMFARVGEMLNEVSSAQFSSARRPNLMSELHNFINDHITAAESEQGLLNRARDLPLDWDAMEKVIVKRRAELNSNNDDYESIR